MELNKKNYTVSETVLPVIPLRGLWMFPHMVMHFDVGRLKSINALETALLNHSQLFVTSQKDMMVEDPDENDIFSIGTIVNVKQTLKLAGGTVRVLVEGTDRGEFIAFTKRDQYLEARVNRIVYSQEQKISKDMEAAMRLVLADMKLFLQYSKDLGEELLLGLKDIQDPGRLADVIGSYVGFSDEQHQEILSELDEYKRLVLLHGMLHSEIEFLKLEEKINRKVVQAINDSQKEYYLKEQLQAIREELGEDDDEDIVLEYREKLKELHLPKDTEEKIEKEINRLAHTPTQTPENNVIRTYLETVFDLPWNELSKKKVDLNQSRRILERDHYGLKDVKERILEFIAIRQMADAVKGPILCLVGPPGVGKTSIAKSIAEALGREFVRMSLGGVRDEAEIRGHRKTYIGAMPGRIISNLTKAKTRNPLFLFDEIDKMANDFRGDPASALLEVLDPAQNNSFMDHYLEIPFDLSQIVFLTTANSEEQIPEALHDRMEIIRLSSYTEEEKFEIAKRHLLPRQMRDHGLKKEMLRITASTLHEIIESYTREAGVRELERYLAKACRRAVKEIIEDNKESVRIDKNNVEKYLGVKRFFKEDFEREPQIGMVTGLAWTSVGGVILTIEAGHMPGAGKVQLTGSLGDVMKESAMASISYIRSHSEQLGIQEDFYKTKDIHIHLPEGATPKDGPSAGVTMTVALISALTNQLVRRDIAMTGEMTLRGKVLPIGGLKEKVLAAYQYGIKTIFIPYENQRDLSEIPEKIRKQLEFVPVKDIHEILERAFVNHES